MTLPELTGNPHGYPFYTGRTVCAPTDRAVFSLSRSFPLPNDNWFARNVNADKPVRKNFNRGIPDDVHTQTSSPPLPMMQQLLQWKAATNTHYLTLRFLHAILRK